MRIKNDKMNITNKKIDWTNPEEEKEYKRQWYLQNKERVSFIKKKQYIENRDKIKSKSSKYYLQNKDTISIKTKKYQEKNKKKISDRGKNYYKKNQNKIIKQSKRYYEKSKKAICIICREPALSQFCNKKCMGIAWTKDNHPNWQGGKSFIPYPLVWTQALRKSIRDRDNNRCLRCGRAREEFKKALAVHHIDADKDNCNPDNLITLCDHVSGSCHGLTRGKEELFSKGFKNILTRLYGYEYKEESKL